MNNDRDFFGGLNPDFAKMLEKAMSDPELLKGIMGDMDDVSEDSDDMTEIMVNGVLNDIKNTISKINYIFDSSDEIEELRDEIEFLIENCMNEFSTIFTAVLRSWYESSEEYDTLNAKIMYRKYRAYITAGFNSEQAFAMINKQEQGNSNMSAINNILNKVNADLSKRNKN